MKFNKLVAALSAVTMLGSLAVAVPASAKTVNGGTGAVTATVSAQVRANDAFVTKNSVTVKTNGAAIEMTQKDGAYFGAYYSFAKSDIPAGATITAATLTITKYDTFKDRSFDVRPVAISDASSTKEGDIFDAVADAYKNATAVTASETSAAGDAPLVADVTSIFDATKANAFFVTNKTVENNKRNLKADATLQVTYTYEEPDDPVAQIGETKYATFAEAMKAATTDSVIKLLADVETYDRFTQGTSADTKGKGEGYTRTFNAPNLTIDGDGHKITVLDASGDNWKFLFETNGRKLTLEDITIETAREKVVNTKNASITVFTDVTAAAPIIATTAASSSVTATNLNVTNATDALDLFASGSTKGTIDIALTAALAADYDVVNGVLTKKAVAPTTTDKYFTFTPADATTTYNTVEVTASNGTKTETKSASLDTSITGATLAIAITGVPAGVTIEKVTLK